jgi:hypothetical protein
MENWTEIEEGSVKMEHNSAASLIKITIKGREEVSQGVFEDTKKEIYLDYGQFSDLQKVVFISEAGSSTIKK